MTLVLIWSILQATPVSTGESSVFWADYGGKGQDTMLVVDQGRPLLEYVKHVPYWEPTQTARIVAWQPVEQPPAVTRLFFQGGPRVYQIDYSDARPVPPLASRTLVNYVLVSDADDWDFRPVLMIDGDDSIVASVYEPEVFVWDDRPMVHVRVQITGTGSLQESHFLTVERGRLAYLRQDREQLRDIMDSRGFGRYHRGGGFCRNSLHEQFMAISATDHMPVGVMRVDWQVNDSRLTVKSFGPAPKDSSCETHYRR